MFAITVENTVYIQELDVTWNSSDITGRLFYKSTLVRISLRYQK